MSLIASFCTIESMISDLCQSRISKTYEITHGAINSDDRSEAEANEEEESEEQEVRR